MIHDVKNIKYLIISRVLNRFGLKYLKKKLDIEIYKSTHWAVSNYHGTWCRWHLKYISLFSTYVISFTCLFSLNQMKNIFLGNKNVKMGYTVT